MSENILEIRGIEAYYGKIQALRGIDLDIREGEIATIIGANGAGKTTLIMSVCGNPRVRTGSIRFNGQEISNLETHKIMHLGIAQAPEGRRIFPRMTVLENLQMGAILNQDREQTFDEDLAKVYDLFPILKTREAQRAGTMSGGEQQMLAISRALMGRPKLLLLDEPSLGLAPPLVSEALTKIHQLSHDERLTVLIVEQKVREVLKIASRVYVLRRNDG